MLVIFVVRERQCVGNTCGERQCECVWVSVCVCWCLQRETPG